MITMTDNAGNEPTSGGGHTFTGHYEGNTIGELQLSTADVRTLGSDDRNRNRRAVSYPLDIAGREIPMTAGSLAVRCRWFLLAESLEEIIERVQRHLRLLFTQDAQGRLDRERPKRYVSAKSALALVYSPLARQATPRPEYA